MTDKTVPDWWPYWARLPIYPGCNTMEGLGKLMAYCYRHPALIHGLRIPYR